MTKYASLSMAVEGYLEKRALSPVVKNIAGTALNVGPAVAFAPSDHASLHYQDPVAQKPWYRTGEGLANLGDWTIGFIPGVGSLWSLGRAGWAALNGNWGEAGLHALGAVPFAGRGLAAAGRGAKAAVAASRAARLAGTATRATRLAGAAARPVAAAANGIGRAAAVAGKIPGVGVVARNPKAIGSAAKIYHDWVGLEQAHQMASNRRAAASQAQQQQQQPQQPNGQPVASVHGATF